MVSVPSLRLRSLVTLLVFFGQRVFGQDQDGRLAILQGRDGQSSCQLRDSVHAACSSSPPPALNDTPTPTVCTCNNVYFNIWSACSFASGNNTLPVLNSWLATCTNNTIDLASGDTMKVSGLGIEVPQWAMIPVPGNTTFDLERAVSIQISPNSWSLLQISLPVVTALSGIMFTLLALKMLRQRPGRVPSLLPKQIDRVFHRGRRVKDYKVNEGDEWEIEPDNQRKSFSAISPDHPPHLQPLPRTRTPVARTPSPPNEHNRESTIPGHPSLPSETPRGSIVPNSQYQDIHSGIQEQFRRYPLRPPPSDPYSGASTPPSALMGSIARARITNPFKGWKKPIAVVSVPPNRRFRIDGSSEGSSSARGSTALTSDAGIRMTGMDFDAIDEGPEEHHNEGSYSSNNDEAESLITGQERQSAIEHGSTWASDHGTINSRIKVVSPTASEISPRSTMLTAGQALFDPYASESLRPRQALPPVPKVPAPLPPPVPGRILVPPVTKAQPAPPAPFGSAASSSRMVMSPILEYQHPDSDPLRSQQGYSSILPSSSSSSRPTPNRSLSEDSTTSSERSRPLPSPLHQRKFSDESQYGRGPLPERPIFASTTSPRLPPNYPQHQRGRSGSNTSGSSIQRFLHDDIYDDPFAPNQRGLSADDTASFYLTPEPVQPFSARSATPTSSRTDPAAYFPGAVKGAGYGGI